MASAQDENDRGAAVLKHALSTLRIDTSTTEPEDDVQVERSAVVKFLSQTRKQKQQSLGERSSNETLKRASMLLEKARVSRKAKMHDIALECVHMGLDLVKDEMSVKGELLLADLQTDAALSYMILNDLDVDPNKDSKNMDKALRCAKESVRIREKLQGDNSIFYARSMYTLAEVRFEREEDEEARECYLTAANLYRDLRGKDDLDYASVMNSCGRMHTRLKEYDEALNAYEEALDIRQFILGPEHPVVGEVCNNMGMWYFSMGYYEKALEYVTRAMDIRKSALGEDHPDFGTSKDNLAMINYTLGNYEEAIPIMQKMRSKHSKVSDTAKRISRAEKSALQTPVQTPSASHSVVTPQPYQEEESTTTRFVSRLASRPRPPAKLKKNYTSNDVMSQRD